MMPPRDDRTPQEKLSDGIREALADHGLSPARLERALVLIAGEYAAARVELDARQSYPPPSERKAS